nr:MAG TPA: hypothetical protein [Caudoviricetes sp.]
MPARKVKLSVLHFGVWGIKPTPVTFRSVQVDTRNGTLKWTLYCYLDGIWFSKPKTEKLIMLSGGI